MSPSSRLICLVTLLMCAIPAVALDPANSACVQLSGPPVYGNPVLGDVGQQRIFRVELDQGGGAPWLVNARARAGGGWRVERLVVVAPDDLRPKTVAELSHRGPEARLQNVFAGDPTGDGRTDMLLYWDLDNGYGTDLLIGESNGFTVAPDPLVLGGERIYEAIHGDFDGDGADELAWRSSEEGRRILLYRYDPGSGYVHVKGKLMGGHPRSFLAMDANGDGVEDLLHIERSYFIGRLLAHLGDRDRPLDVAEARWLPLQPIMLADRSAEGESVAEVAVLYTEVRPGYLQGLRMDALVRRESGEWDRLWSEPLPLEYNRSPQVWDVDRDGHDDFVFPLGSYWNALGGFQILRYRDDGPYEPKHRSRGEATLVDVLPIDGDDLPDALLVASGGLLGRYRGVEPLRFDEGQTIWEGGYDDLRGSDRGDLDGDGLEDLVVTVDDYDNVVWWRSLGNGEYQEHPLEPLPGNGGRVRVMDLDGDSHQDVVINSYIIDIEQHVLFVAWGREEGGPGSWRPALQGHRLMERAFADLDGDGDIDLLARDLRGRDWRDGTDLRLFLNQGRSFRLADGHFIPPFDKGGAVTHLTAADIDGDGLVDAIHYANDPEDRHAGRLVWRRHLGDGRLAPPQDLLEQSLSFLEVVPADVDRDDDVDLIVLGGCLREGESVRVLGNDDGRFRPYWSGPPSDDCPRVRVVDIDGDGLLDLHEFTGEAAFRVWMANGSGGFDPAGAGFFVGSRTSYKGLVADVLKGPGLDHVQPDGWPEERRLFTVAQRTGKLERDVAPPELSFRLVPEVDTFGKADRFAGFWRVGARAVDECTVPRVTRAFARIPALDPQIPARFVRAAHYEFRLYESLETAAREVVLSGPDEAAARDLFAAVVTEGGFELAPNTFLEIQTHDDWGRPPHEVGEGDPVTLPGARLTHVWGLDEGELDRVRVLRPEADIRFDVEAVDASGKSARATGSYQAERQRYCETHPGAETICE